MADKNLSRIRRQFDVFGRRVPPAKHIIDPMMSNRMRWLRVPVGVLLMAGGVFAILPVLGFWMFPLGLLLLAVDIPMLRPGVAAGTIRARRRVGRFTRRHRKAEER